MDDNNEKDIKVDEYEKEKQYICFYYPKEYLNWLYYGIKSDNLVF